MLRTLLAKLFAITRVRYRDEDLRDEIVAHIEALVARHVAHGLSPTAARAAARREFGGVEQIKEAYRESRGLPWLDDLVFDLRGAIRGLWRHRAFTSVAVTVSLALGVGAAAAVFSAVQGILLSPFPYKDPSTIFAVKTAMRGAPPSPAFMQASRFADVLTAHAIDDGIMWDLFPMTSARDALPEAVSAGKVSLNTFQFLGVPPLLGRTFDGDFSAQSADTGVAVLGYRYWHSRYGGARDVLGRTIDLDHRPYTIVGVMPERFRFLDADLYVPLPSVPSPFPYLVRLAPGVTAASATGELEPMFREMARQFKVPNYEELTVSLVAWSDDATGHMSALLTILSSAVALLLVSGCVNVSILLIAKGHARRHELTVRTAIGATSGRLVRQLLTESALVGAAGGTLGIGVAYLLLGAILRWLPANVLPSDIRIGIDGRVLLFSLIAGILSGLIAGTLPALRAIRSRRMTSEFSGREVIASAGSARIQGVLILAQVALTVLVVVGSAASLRIVLSMTRVDLGYVPQDVSTFSLALNEGAFPEWAARVAYYERIRAAAAETPGVLSAALSLQAPQLLPPVVPNRTRIQIGADSEPQTDLAAMQAVSPDYFSTLRIPVRRGRIWAETENRRAGQVAVVNAAFVQRYLSNRDPIGARVTIGTLRTLSPYQTPSPHHSDTVTIVGVVGDVRNDGVLKPVIPHIYIPYSIATWDSVTLEVRSQPGVPVADAVTKAVVAVNGRQPVNPVSTLDARLREAGFARQQFVTALFTLCAGFALALAAVGLYSVVSYVVGGRLREFAVRSALGATPRTIYRLVFSSVGAVAVAGLAVGAGLTVLINARVTALTNTSMLNAPAFSGGIAILVITGFAAILAPAYRAVTSNPVSLLRNTD